MREHLTKGKIVTTTLMPYCVVNEHNDLIAVFRFSETANNLCELMNSQDDKKSFSVAMSSNVITRFSEFKYI